MYAAKDDDLLAQYTAVTTYPATATSSVGCKDGIDTSAHVAWSRAVGRYSGGFSLREITSAPTYT